MSVADSVNPVDHANEPSGCKDGLVSYDWKKLNDDETRKMDRATLPLGVGFTIAGFLGILTFFLVGKPDTAAGCIVFVVLGVPMIVVGARRRRSNR